MGSKGKPSRFWLVIGLVATFLLGGACCVLSGVGIVFFQKLREAEAQHGNQGQMPPQLGIAEVSKERTFAYWGEIKNLYFQTALANASNKKMDFAAAAASLRLISQKIDDLATEEVDPEAVECGKAISELMLTAAPLFDKVAVESADPTLVFQAMFDIKGAASGFAGDLRAIRDQAESLRNQANKVDTQVRRTRSALSKRHGMEFPRLLPPVMVVLQPFLISDGYYVIIQNTSSSEPVSVTVTYTDAVGTSTTQQSGTINPGSVAKLDPSDISWRVAAGGTITVSTDGYSYTYDVDSLIPK